MPTLQSLMVRGFRAARFGMRGRKGAFEHIFRSRYWGNEESVSGPGSSLAQTAAIRAELPKIVQRYAIRSLFDAPCGDLYWMSRILGEMGIRYVGGDIVPEVIELARSRTDYADAHFVAFDIADQSFPDATCGYAATCCFTYLTVPFARHLIISCGRTSNICS